MGFDIFIALLFMLAVGFFSGYCVHKGNTIDYRQRWKRAIAILDTDEVAQALIEHNVWYDKTQGKAGKAHTMPSAPAIGTYQGWIDPDRVTAKFMEHSDHQGHFRNKMKQQKIAENMRKQRKYKEAKRKMIEDQIRKEFSSYYAVPPTIMPESTYQVDQYHDPFYLGRAIPTVTEPGKSIYYKRGSHR